MLHRADIVGHHRHVLIGITKTRFLISPLLFSVDAKTIMKEALISVDDGVMVGGELYLLRSKGNHNYTSWLLLPVFLSLLYWVNLYDMKAKLNSFCAATLWWPR